MLGAHEAEALGAVSAGAHGVGRVVGVGPHAKGADFVRPREQLRQVRVVDVGDDRWERPEVDVAEGAVYGDDVAFLDALLADGHLTLVEVYDQCSHADDRWLAELPRDEGGVASAPARAREDAAGSEHAVDVVRLRLGADHDDVAPFLRPALRGVCIERDDADGRARRDVEPGGQLASRLARASFELRVQEVVHLLGLDAPDGLFLAEHAFLDHVDGDADFGLRGALAVARLQHPELAVLDGELHVLHVAVVAFEPLSDGLELRVRRWHDAGELV